MDSAAVRRRSALSAKWLAWLGWPLLCWSLWAVADSVTGVAPLSTETTYTDPFTPVERAFIDAHPVLRVHNETDWPPFNFNENGRPSGYSIDYMNLLAEKSGFRIEYVTGPSWDEFMQMIRSKQIDVMLNIVNTPERREFLTFTDAYLVAAASIYIRKGDQPVAGLEALQGKTVAIPKGFFWQELLQRYYPKVRLLLLRDSLECLEAVAFGRADATVGMVGVLDYLLQKNFIPNLVLAAQVKDTRFASAMHIAVNKDNPMLRDILQKAMNLVTEQELVAIQRRWGERRAGPSMALSKEERQFVDRHPVVRAHVEKDYSPFLYMQDGRATGYVVDYAQLLAEKIGMEIFFTNERRREEAVAALVGRQVDLILAMEEGPVHRQYADFTRPYLTTYTGVAYRKEQRNLSTLEALRQKRVATVTGYPYATQLKKRFPEMQLLKYPGHQAALEAVSLGEVDAAVMSHPVMRYLIQKNFFSDLATAPVQDDSELKRSQEAIAVRNDWPMLKNLLDRAISQVTTEELNRLKQKWDVQLQGEAFSDVSFTDKEREYLKQRKRIRMCVTPDWMPYESIDEQGRLIGMTADFVKLLEGRLGTPWELVPTRTWGETLQRAKDRVCDVITLAAANPQRESFLRFTTPYVSFPSVIATRNEELFVENIRQVKDRRLGVVKDYAIGKTIRRRYPNLQLVEVASVQDGLRRVRSREIYGLVDAAPTIGYAIRQLGYPDVKIAGKTEFMRELSMAVRSDDPLLFSVIDKAVRATTPEERQQIYSKWINVEYVSGVDYLLIGQILLGVLLILGFFIYQNRRLARYNRQIRLANEQAALKNELLLEKQRELERLSITDRLTRIYNRIKLDEVFNQELRRADRYGQPFAVIMLDVDDFKQVNDRFGHPVGDQVLVEMANLLLSGIRQTDTVGRWGGEEFFIICPQADATGALHLAESLRARIDQHSFPEVGHLTASFGIAVYREGEQEHDMVKRADVALYRAKRAGKNRVEAYDE
ncbi:transporter substrate-binding domain-containing diguanylate cyclase [Sedimenticola sp.]|uniref:transporter substrate-binding domain-containing diguanylate cyclase n=1 Tax=Sedimenticola sp. TaxID=1940285 RepID=UPI003D146164